MTDPEVDRTFDALELLMTSMAINSAADQAEDFVTRVQMFIEEYLAGVFPDLADWIDAEQETSPTFGSYAPKWADLELNYRDWKEARGVYGFAQLTGASKGRIAGLDARRVFGNPRARVFVSVGGSSLSYMLDSKKRWRLARGSRDASGRGIGGRFAARLSHMQNLKAAVSFEPAENVEMIGAKINYSWMTSNVSQAFAAFERGRRGNKQPARPLMEPYLKWKLGEQLTSELRGRFGISQ